MKTAIALTLALCLAQSAFAQAPTAPPAEASAPAAPPAETSAAPSPAPASTAPTLTPEEAAAEDARIAKEFFDSLNKRTGDIPVASGKVMLHVPAGYYYLDNADSKHVLVDAWGNPPDAMTGVEGMLFAANVNPLDPASWGAVVEFANDGYVSDKDAKTVDYTKLLKDMQKQTEDMNAERVKQGFSEMHLIGWAEPPRYDAATHKMYWAEHIRVAKATGDTLNYRIRALGREGVLVVNFIAGMEQLEQVKQEAQGVMAVPSFTPGHTYADHADGDRKAEYGIAGLVAGGLGLAAAQKFGLFAIILAFGKKFLVLIIAAMAGGASWLKNLFSGKKPAEDDVTPEPVEPAPAKEDTPQV